MSNMGKGGEGTSSQEAPLHGMERVKYLLLSGLFAFVGVIPFRLLYLLSDLMAFLLDDVIRYRRKVVEGNLRSCLPELPEDDLKRTRKRFYRFLGDYFLETAKMGSMSEAEIRRRMRFENIDAISERLRRGENVSLLLGHYCNWEWVSSLPLHFPPEAACGQIYHRLHSAAADRLFLKVRGHFGATSIAMADTLRVRVGWKREGKASVVGYIADQAPKVHSAAHWMDFLHHDTAVFTGPERISQKLRCSVFYLDMEQVKRGYYVGRFVELTRDASQEAPMKVTEAYFRMLEQTIEARPPFWLWSHKRWKRSRADYARK